MTRVVIVGGGFAGLNAAKVLGGAAGVDVTVIDKHNHHLFQPLLYQVAMAGLSPAEIAAPIRSMLSEFPNIRVLLAEVLSVYLQRKVLATDIGEIPFDYLVLCCGATHSYFGHDEWEEFAPGLKTLEQATEIRRRVLTAFEKAESLTSDEERTKLLTFVIVGGGPTGVELAGAIGEMSRFTLAKDFRSINAQSARVILIEAGPRILPAFSEKQARRAVKDLEDLGVQVRMASPVTSIDADGVQMGEERLPAGTVLWAAGVKASPLGKFAGLEVDVLGRVIVEPDLSVKGHPNVLAAGDQSRFTDDTGKPLPGTAPVAMQQGRHIGRLILGDLEAKPRRPFKFIDKGQMATIGRSRAILEKGSLKMAGWPAWLAWLAVHIYYLTGFRNRLLVVLQWAWSYLTFSRGARLILDKEWRLAPRRQVMDEFMREAVREAERGMFEGGIPIGSVLVHRGKILGRGHNKRVQKGSAVFHAEMDALENAGRQAAEVYRESTIYTTLSPCAMCSGAILHYAIPRVIIGENHTYRGEEDLLHSRGVSLHVLQDETCIRLMTKFIAEHPALWHEDIGKPEA